MFPSLLIRFLLCVFVVNTILPVSSGTEGTSSSLSPQLLRTTTEFHQKLIQEKKERQHRVSSGREVLPPGVKEKNGDVSLDRGVPFQLIRNPQLSLHDFLLSSVLSQGPPVS